MQRQPQKPEKCYVCSVENFVNYCSQVLLVNVVGGSWHLVVRQLKETAKQSVVILTGALRAVGLLRHKDWPWAICCGRKHSAACGYSHFVEFLGVPADQRLTF